MAGSRSVFARSRRAWEGVRSRGVRVTLRHLLRRAGIHIVPYYWVKEVLPADLPSRFMAAPQGFECGVFGEEEIAAIARIRDRDETLSGQQVLDRVRDGHTCLGMKRNGEIVAFSWFALDASHSKLFPAVMQPNEAYLFDMYVVPSARGHNLAPVLRYQCYEMLRQLGRDTCYSITVASNKASWRFKQKLGGQRLFLGIYARVFGRFEHRWVLWRY